MSVLTNSGFWDGAAGAALTGSLGTLGAWIVRRESRQKNELARQEALELRLQHWQESTVQAVRAENAELRAKVEACETKHASQATSVRVLGLVIKLALPALRRAEPQNVALVQCGQLLRSLPVQPDVPSEWTSLIDQLDMDF